MIWPFSEECLYKDQKMNDFMFVSKCINNGY